MLDGEQVKGEIGEVGEVGEVGDLGANHPKGVPKTAPAPAAEPEKKVSGSTEAESSTASSGTGEAGESGEAAAAAKD
jgi:hypothetical protein